MNLLEAVFILIDMKGTLNENSSLMNSESGAYQQITDVIDYARIYLFIAFIMIRVFDA